MIYLRKNIDLFFCSLVVGIGAGLGAIFFRYLIDQIHYIAYGNVAQLLQSIAPYHLLIIPALGGAVFGPIIHKFAREAKGHGVPEVMEAVSLHGGIIRPRVAVIKSLASAICIGTGGSVGREGPIAQIGAALGSTIGQFFRLSQESMNVLVACGTAGGIAATFNAPIAGAIFGMEIILRRLSTVSMCVIVISAVTADAVAINLAGNYRPFLVPEYTLLNQRELFFYALLGLMTGLVSVGFTRLLYLTEDLWSKTRISGYFLPMIGGIVLGGLGLISSEVD